MFTPYPTIGASLSVVVAAAVVVSAQQPRITNGQVSPRPSGALAETFRSIVAAEGDLVWVGYTVPVVDSERMMCCFDGNTSWTSGSVSVSSAKGCCNACRLEPPADGTAMARRSEGTGAAQVVRLSAPERMTVLYRIAARSVERIRTFSEDCELDAGGRTIIWLENVRPAESIALLASLATGERRSDRLADGAITAIALHGDPAADGALEKLAHVSQPEGQRRKVTFWLGNARGARGLAMLTRLLADDPSAEVQKGAVFGISQSREPGVFDVLASVARTDARPRNRGEALFWIAQRDDNRAAPIILEALEKDSSPEVRKKAVFALGQLKDDAGIDALLRVARSAADPATRSEAIFWLGQKAGAKAAGAITQAIEQDPETDVKKRAVFALSQMPRDQGIPLLINVARTHPNSAVRKQAMFWLGQSKDPRAIEFFAEVLR